MHGMRTIGMRAHSISIHPGSTRRSSTHRSGPTRRHAGGMTLIEVLVTLVIISVGLLGVAAMQLTTVRNNYDAFVRSQAAVLAGDILDRMRANRQAVLNDAYNVEFEETPSESPDAVAKADIDAWKATLAAQLPDGDGSITTLQLDPGATTRRAIVTVSIRWGERGEAEPLVFTTSSQI